MSLPVILSGPILRRTTPTELVIWLCTSRPVNLVLELYHYGDSQPFVSIPTTPDTRQCIRIGEQAVVQLLTIAPDPPLPRDQVIGYDLVADVDGNPRRLRDLLPHLIYTGQQRPCFTLPSRIKHLLHGSCRKPHHPGPDALLRVDELIGQTLTRADQRPALLMMSGDQIYADDVAGPMLRAIHRVIERLGLYSERLSGATVANSSELYDANDGYYRRQHLLPQTEANEVLRGRFFGGTRKPIFTTDSAHNHLITLAEVNAMYLLVDAENWMAHPGRPM